MTIPKSFQLQELEQQQQQMRNHLLQKAAAPLAPPPAQPRHNNPPNKRPIPQQPPLNNPLQDPQQHQLEELHLQRRSCRQDGRRNWIRKAADISLWITTRAPRIGRPLLWCQLQLLEEEVEVRRSSLLLQVQG